MRRAGLIVALAVAIPMLFAPTAAAHATCSSHTHWTSLTNYRVTYAGDNYCSGVVRKLGWSGWRIVGYFGVPR